MSTRLLTAAEVKQNPVALIDRPRQPRQGSRRIRFLQPVEVGALLRAIPDDALGAVQRPRYLCAVESGLRQGELLALKPYRSARAAELHLAP